MAASTFIFGVFPTLLGGAIIGGPAVFVPLAALMFIAAVPGTH
jgi:hypothetical protein